MAHVAVGHRGAAHELVKAILGPDDPGLVYRLELVVAVNDVVRVRVWRYPDEDQLRAAARHAAALAEGGGLVVEEMPREG